MNTATYKLELTTTEIPVHFARNPKARRYILRFRDGTAHVTIPRGGNLQFAQDFIRKHKSWLDRQVLRASAQWTDGTTFLLRGEPARLTLLQTANALLVTFADQQLSIDPSDDVRCAVESRLRTLATRELIARTYELATLHQMEIRSVSVRNQRSRWGSCSIRKTISLNWRLIQTPLLVRDYIITHELMHLKEMNHSSRFWAHVESAFPHYREAEKWLRKNSSLLR